VAVENKVSVRTEQVKPDRDETTGNRSSPNSIFHFMIYAFGVGTLTGPAVRILTALVGAAKGQRITLSFAIQVILILILGVFAGLYAETAIANLRRCWVVLRFPRN
jgi:VIT1/CCC1 family predicted Fe2+/Mn2+ transporter